MRMASAFFATPTLLALFLCLGCGGGASKQDLVDEINQAFAGKPADIGAFFSLIHVTDPGAAEVIEAMSQMLSASTRLRHAAEENIEGPLPEDLAPTMALSARLQEGGEVPRIVIVDENGQENLADIVEVEGRWRLTTGALGEDFEQQLASSQVARVSSMARRMAPVFDGVAEQVERGTITSQGQLLSAIQAAMMAAMQEPAAN